MHGDPEPMGETSGGNRSMVVASASVPRARRGANDLHARQAVQTCVLSKLWRDLWRNVRRINASCRAFQVEFSRRINASGLELVFDGYYCDHQRSLLNAFVNRLLMLRNPVSLDKFRLWYFIDDETHEADAEEASQWIHHALLCNARSVEVFFWDDKFRLNPAVFTSEHLTSLLFYSVDLNRGFFRQLQTGCKALERLILQECSINDIEITSETLKFLSIGSRCNINHQASLSLPNLVHLGICDEYRPGEDWGRTDRIPLVKNMGSLETAYINMLAFNQLRVDDICQFLLGLSGVAKLYLHFGFGLEKSMTAMGLQCPKFNNLKFLSLRNSTFYQLIAFLQNSPNLEHLTLDMYKGQYAEVPAALMPRPGNTSFTCQHLNTVEIISSKNNPRVKSLMEFLVGNGISAGHIHIKQ